MENGYFRRCYYEVLGLESKCTEQEVRRAYKLAALRCHPDKNQGRESEAEEEFKEVHNAYSVLNDPDERAWYDSHKESILRGDVDGGCCAPDELDVTEYLSRKCFTGFGNDDQGFYSVYRKVFDTLIKEEQAYETTMKDAPTFGDVDTPYHNVAQFYLFWKYFNTNKTFAWKDEYKVNELPDRWCRREGEKMNKKVRTTARREYTQILQQLAIFVYNRDPRVKKEKERRKVEEEKKEEQTIKRNAEAAKRRWEANKKIWEEAAIKEEEEEARRAEAGEELDGSTLEMLYEKQRQLEKNKKSRRGLKNAGGGDGTFGHPDMINSEEEDSGDEVSNAQGNAYYRCNACKKTFNAPKLWEEHIKSGKHKSKLKVLEKKGVDLSTILITPNLRNSPVGDEKEKNDTSGVPEAVSNVALSEESPSMNVEKEIEGDGGNNSNSKACINTADNESSADTHQMSKRVKKTKNKKR
eukprot:Tbor_TRINITY_DN5382_c3_g1::TRINITY_DN5382_c3_g1_i1::g.4245::m.4245/K09506/DNAJA5; DnaJ homolog subfamily A member 5